MCPQKSPEIEPRAVLSDQPPHRSPTPLAWWKKLLFSLLATGLFFCLVEVLLCICGVTPILFEADPYVGFSDKVPLFEERLGITGMATMVTANNKAKFFNQSTFPRNKTPNTYRIFCVGGSTTYGRPYDDATSFSNWLREMLPVADPTHPWEVINTGGISYASYRVALLMEELIRYQPDLFIIYSGHNEFLERRTYSTIIETPKLIRGLNALMIHSRTYSAIGRLVQIRKNRKVSSASGKSLLPGEVKAMLDRSIGPQDYHRDDELSQKILSHYRYNLARMIKISRSVGAKVILVTPASNLRECAPFKSEHRAGLTQDDQQRFRDFLRGGIHALKTDSFDKATEMLEDALAIDDRYAMAHYRYGQALDGLGRYPEAKVAFRRARDEDICPLRALSPVQTILAQVATDQDVPLVDFVSLAEENSPQTIPGENLFLDHVHPQISGHRLLAVNLIETLMEANIVHPTSTWGKATIEKIAKKIGDQVDHQAHGVALKNLAKVLGWSGKIDEADRLADRAADLIPDDPEVHFNLGLRDQIQGNLAEAAQHFKEALRVQRNYPPALRRLSQVLVDQGQIAEATDYLRQAVELEPKNVKTLYKLGNLYARQRKWELATSCFTKCLDIRPKHSEIQFNLAVVTEMQGDLVEAKTHFQRVLAIDPQNHKAHFRLGRLAATQGQLTLAVQHFARVVEQMPENALAYYQLGLIRMRQNKWFTAKQNFEQAIQIQSDFAEAHQKLGQVFQQGDDLAKASACYRQALHYQPNLLACANLLAGILASADDVQLRDGKEALRLSRQVVQAMGHQKPMVLATLAKSYAEVGRFQEAIDTAEKALELARTSEQLELVAQLQRLLRLFRNTQPFREKSPLNSNR